MISPGRGTLALSIDAPGPTPARLTVRDPEGRVLTRRRLRARHTDVELPAGRLQLSLEDDRPLHDPRRHGGQDLDVEVVAGRTLEQTMTLVRGALVRACFTHHDQPVRFARVAAVHADGERLDLRADDQGGLVVAGLRPGTWILQAHDSRYRHAALPVVLEVVAGALHQVRVDLDQETARVLLSLHGAGRRPVPTTTATFTHTATGHTVTACPGAGLLDVRGLLPGSHTLHVPAALGHLATDLTLEVAPDGLTLAEAHLPAGALLSGRVVQDRAVRRGRYAAVVTLHDGEGRELERVRTDGAGRFEIGTGLTSADDLTVVATSGPETLHVTRVARAEVGVVTGVRHDLGDLPLPVAGRDATWAPSTPYVCSMKLPSTRM